MEWIMVVFGLLYVIFFICNVSTNNKGDRAASAFLLTMSAVIFFAFLTAYEARKIPTAMDVYQGKTILKTTFEITYRDTIPVDSIVVFKDEFKK